MSFVLRLDVPAALPPDGVADVTYDEALDDVLSILAELCASLAELPGVRFVATVGEPLPVDVRVDLVVVLEQLRDLLMDLRQKAHAVLDLYEQGIQTRFVLTVMGDLVRIERHGLSDSATSTSEIDVPYAAILDSLHSLARAFVAAATRRSPVRCAHPWFQDWAASLLDAVAEGHLK